ncbi:MAG: hypothetical protein IJF44_00200 [Clostridia bacterium]|nr:hypothetical protein [Clostridia bacterium]
MSRRDEMLYYEDDTYESKQKRKRQRPKKKGRWLGRIICLFLGFILGIGGTVGAVVGIGYWAWNQPLEKTVNKIDSLAGTNLYASLFGETDENGNFKAGILHKDYASAKVKELVSDVSDVFGGISDEGTSLADFNNISPKTGEAVEKLLSALEKYAIHLDLEKTLNAPFKSGSETTLTTYFKDSMMQTAAGDFFNAMSDETSPLLTAICYGEENVHYTVDADGVIQMQPGCEKTTFGDLLGSDFNTILNRVPAETVLNPSEDDSVMCAIAYGSSARYTFVNDKAEMKQVSYTVETVDGSLQFITDKNEALVCTYEPITDGYKLIIDTGKVDENSQPITETQYVQIVGEEAKAYTDESFETVLKYKKVSLGDLQQDAMSIVDNVLLKDALAIDASSHKVLISLAYGNDYKIVGEGDSATIEGGTARTIGQLRAQGGNLIDDIPLADIMGEDRDDKLVMYLLYGKENIHYAINPSTNEIEMLQRRIAISADNKIYNEYGEFLKNKEDADGTYVDADGTVYKYVVSGLGDIETKDGNTATLYYLTDEAGNEVKYKKTSLGDMAGSDNLISRLSSRLTVGEVMNVEDDHTSHNLIKHVQDVIIDDLPAAINDLTVWQVYGSDIFEEGHEGDPNYLKSNTWWYLLNVNGVIEDYKISEMELMIDNLKENIHYATLQQLKDDGMIQFGPSTLGESIKYKIYYTTTQYIEVMIEGEKAENVLVNADGTPKQTYGELTVEEMLLFVDGMISAVNELESILGV